MKTKMESRTHFKKRGVFRKALRLGNTNKFLEMACRTPSVERVADNSVNAKAQIDKLEKLITDQEAAHKALFYSQIDAHLQSAQIDDARETDYKSNIKTEYTSEFSLDKIIGVVTSALKAAKAASNPANPQAEISPAAIDAYSDVVVSIGEAAKSSSNSASSLAFSMSRLAPGTIAFLYATSTKIQDSETFGDEAVTTTSIYYRIIQSETDVKLQGAFDATKIRVAADLETYRRFVALQAKLVDDLANDKISFEEYDKKDTAYESKAAQLQKRVKDGSPAPHVAAMARVAAPSITLAGTHHDLVQSAIDKMSTMGSKYAKVIETAQSRLAMNYF